MPSAARLSVGALGLAIVLLVSAAWGTGLWYLVARLGLPSPVQLAWMDGVHVYVGLVAGLLVIGKLARVRWLALVAAAIVAGALTLVISAPERMRPLFRRRPGRKIGSPEVGAAQSAPSPERRRSAGGG